MTRVVLADDHAPTRAGVREALEAGGFTVVAELAAADPAVAAALEHRPELCLLDIHMPGDGIEAARAIHAQLPATAIVMLTVSESDEDLMRALRAGAVGYLLKGTNPDRLPDALRGVLAGEAAIPRTLVAKLVKEIRVDGTRRSPIGPNGVTLTDREWQVLDLLAERRSTLEIANTLDISAVTVRRHVSGLLAKLGVADREAAVEAARAHTR